MGFVVSALTPTTEAFVHGNQVYTEIAETIATSLAWTFVSTVTYTGPEADTTHEVHVWRCAASVSGLANDYHVMFDTTKVTSTSAWKAGVSVSIAEDFNPGSNVYGGYAPYTAAATYTLGADRRIAVTGTLSATEPTPPRGYYTVASGNPASLSVAILVTDKTIILSTDADQTLFYIGEFQSFMPAADDPMPICVWSTNSADTNFAGRAGACTRHPKVSTSTPLTHALQLDYWYDFTFVVGSPGDPDDYDLFHGGPNLSRILVLSYIGGGALVTTNGRMRGLYRHVVSGVSPIGTAVWGDTFIVNGAIHLYTGDGSYIDTTA